MCIAIHLKLKQHFQSTILQFKKKRERENTEELKTEMNHRKIFSRKSKFIKFQNTKYRSEFGSPSRDSPSRYMEEELKSMHDWKGQPWRIIPLKDNYVKNGW